MPAQYPVDINDNQGLNDAVNYLLSGPAGLGQNFSGYSSYTSAWLTGNYRSPYTVANTAKLYVAPISLSLSEMLDGRTYKFTFSSAQATPPFANGNGIVVSGTSDSWYNDSYVTIGVIQCTTTYVIVRTQNSYDIVAPATGGTIELTTGTGRLSTDANSRVTVTGGTDRIFISAQLDQLISYTGASASTLEVKVQVNKYYGYIDPDPVNPDIKFNPWLGSNSDGIVAQKIYTYTGLTGAGTLPLLSTVFATIVDQPTTSTVLSSTDASVSWTGYFWYILEVSFKFTSGTGQVSEDQLGLRSISTQVVKQ